MLISYVFTYFVYDFRFFYCIINELEFSDYLENCTISRIQKYLLL